VHRWRAPLEKIGRIVSIKIINRVAKIDAGGPSNKAVLLAYARYSDDGGKCWPSIATISAETELSPNTVRRCRANLRSRKLIRCDERYQPGTKCRSSDIVWVTLPAEAADTSPHTSLHGGSTSSHGGSTRTPTVMGRYSHGGGDKRESSLETSLKKDSRSVADATRPVDDSLFERFVKAFPKQEGLYQIKPVRVRFNKMVRGGADPEQIIACAGGYAKQVRGGDAKYVKEPQQWDAHFAYYEVHDNKFMLNIMRDKKSFAVSQEWPPDVVAEAA
jgi:hypothetical protein